MDREAELEKTRGRWKAFGTASLLGAICFLVGPFIFVAVKGLVGLAVAGAVCLALNAFVPALTDGFANWRLKMLKAEAARNPIETLQNEYADRQDRLEKFKDSIESFSASTMDFEDKLVGFKKDYPDDAPKFDKQLRQMKDLLQVRKDKYRDAVAQLKLFAGVIKRASAIWDMTQAAIAAGKAAGMTDQDFMSKLKTDTALDSVTTSMNVAFSDLELSLSEEKESPVLGLPAPSAKAIVLSAKAAKEHQ